MITIDDTQNLIENLTMREIRVTLVEEVIGFKLPEGATMEGKVFKTSLPRETTMGKFIKDLDIPLENIQDINIGEGTLEEAFVNLLKQQEA